MADGFPVVLSADRTLTADYTLLFDGMAAGSLTTTTPRWLFNRLMTPLPRIDGVRAAVAPLGLRRVEAALLRDGFGSDEVAVVDEDHLAQAIGPATRVIALASGDPAGRGMNSTTMQAIMGGQPWTARCFGNLLDRVRRLRRERAPGAKIVLGGPGAWQVTASPPAGIDTVISGYCEAGIAAQIRACRDGAPLPPTLAPEVAAIPGIRGATTMGAVEISRGCGWGCGFCTIAGTPMRHLAPAAIAADIRVNLAAGIRQTALLSEDCFRYGGGAEALLGLLQELRRLPGLGLMQIDHANLASAAGCSDARLTAMQRLLGGGAVERTWINVGVESVDGSLLLANSGPAKLGGCPPEAWADFCEHQLRRLVGAGFFPFVSLVFGLPGETPETLEATRRWIGRLDDLGLGVFPLLLAPVDGSAAPEMGREHWRLLDHCWRRNFSLLPRLYRDQQRATGVSALRRALIGLLGRGQAMQWRALMAWHTMRASP